MYFGLDRHHDSESNLAITGMMFSLLILECLASSHSKASSSSHLFDVIF